MPNISQFPLKLIKNFSLYATLTLLLMGCFTSSNKQEAIKELPKIVQLATPEGRLLKTHLAITGEEQIQGLSGKKKDEFSIHEGMLFLYSSDGIRAFWMPDTYFDLDLFFLDKNLKVIDVHRDLAFHPGRQEPIPRSKEVYCRHVLEIASHSPLAKNLKKGDTLKWMGQISLSEIESRIRLLQ